MNPLLRPVNVAVTVRLEQPLASGSTVQRPPARGFSVAPRGSERLGLEPQTHCCQFCDVYNFSWT